MTRTLKLLSLAVLPLLTGCATPMLTEADLTCDGPSPPGVRTDTLVIFIGATPDVAKLAEVPELTKQFQRAGYNAKYFEPWNQLQDHEVIADWIRTARRRGQRVMLVGWSLGTVVGHKALRIAEQEGLGVDTFVELDCFNLNVHMMGDTHRRNVGRTIVIRSRLNRQPDEYPVREFHHLETARHLSVPTDPTSLAVLYREARLLNHKADLARRPVLPTLKTQIEPPAAVRHGYGKASSAVPLMVTAPLRGRDVEVVEEVTPAVPPPKDAPVPPIPVFAPPARHGV